MAYFADKVPEHCLCHLKIRNHTVFEWTDRDNVTRSSAQHTLCVITNRDYFVTAGLDSHDGRFPEDDPVILNVDQCVGCPKVDTHILGEHSEEFGKHVVRLNSLER